MKLEELLCLPSLGSHAVAKKELAYLHLTIIHRGVDILRPPCRGEELSSEDRSQGLHEVFLRLDEVAQRLLRLLEGRAREQLRRVVLQKAIRGAVGDESGQVGARANGVSEPDEMSAVAPFGSDDVGVHARSQWAAIWLLEFPNAGDAPTQEPARQCAGRTCWIGYRGAIRAGTTPAHRSIKRPNQK